MGALGPCGLGVTFRLPMTGLELAGFIAYKPITEDYVPVLPTVWGDVVGMALGQHALSARLAAARSKAVPAWRKPLADGAVEPELGTWCTSRF